MIPINTPCPECMARMTAGVEVLPDDGERKNLFFWCPHNRVSAAVEVLPGKLLGHWTLQPARSEEEALRMAQNSIDENEFLNGLYGQLAQAQKPAITN